MAKLNKAFRLLDGFASLSKEDQHRRVVEVERLLRAAEKKKATSLLALREIDQLRKQHAYMLISSGKIDDGINSINLLVAEYSEAINNLNDEAAFQLAEAAIACFRGNMPQPGEDFARAALMHAGRAKRLNKTVLTAFEYVQRLQETRSGPQKQDQELS